MSDSGPRLLLITDKFAPHTGGTAVIYRQWCDRLPADRVHVLTCWFRGAEEFDRQAPYRVERVPYLNIPKIRMPLLWARLRRAAYRAVKVDRPDVVHAGQIVETGLTALRLKRRHGIPYIVHVYGEEINYFAGSRIGRIWLRAVLDGASAVTSISQYTIRRMVDLGLWRGPVTLLYPGVETDRFRSASGESVRGKYGLGSAPVLLTVARLLERKGHDRVLGALGQIRRRLPDVKYLIVGAGMEESRLRALAASLGLSNSVLFVGSIPHDQIPGYFAIADVFVHPNRELDNGDVEGFGIVFLEANACGIPVIGGNSGGTPDAIQDGVTGFLVDPSSVDEIADRIIRLLCDSDLRRRMGEAGRKWAAQFSWEIAASKVWDLSSKVAGGSA